MEKVSQRVGNAFLLAVSIVGVLLRNVMTSESLPED